MSDHIHRTFSYSAPKRTRSAHHNKNHLKGRVQEIAFEMTEYSQVSGGVDHARLVCMLSETLSNLDVEHRERLSAAARASGNPALRAQVIATLTERHRERRSAYLEAIGRLRSAAGALRCEVGS